MAIIATDSTRFSGVVNREYDPASGFCRDTLTYNGPAITVNVGTVVGKYYTGMTLTAGAVVGTGNGTVGSISVASSAFTEIGVYQIRMTAATTFTVNSPRGSVIGTGATGTAFSQNGLTFTVTAGGTAFVAGDMIPLTVTGTVKVKPVVATATDGSQNAVGVIIADVMGLSKPQTPTLNTDTPMLALTRGPVIVEKGGLQFDASITGNFLTVAYAQLTALGIIPETTN